MASQWEGRMFLNTRVTTWDTHLPLRQHIEDSTMQFVQKNVHEAGLNLVNTGKVI